MLLLFETSFYILLQIFTWFSTFMTIVAMSIKFLGIVLGQVNTNN